MRLLKERIVKDGKVLPGNILKVDSFLNHQLDISLLEELAKEFHRLFKDEGITKVVTIEASGIAIACFVAKAFEVPLVFAKKAKSKNIGDDVYQSVVHSYTYDNDYTITVNRAFIEEDDRILIIDDFLANGKALEGLIDICTQGNAEVAGIGIAIEKDFQPGGKIIREKGFRLESLARIARMDGEEITFVQ